MQSRRDFPFARRILKRVLPIAHVHRVLAEKLIPERLGQRNAMRVAKLYRLPRDHIPVGETSQMLMTAGEKSIGSRKGGGAERSDFFFEGGLHQRHRLLEQGDRFMMPACEVMKTSFDCERVRGLERIGVGIPHPQ